MKFDELYKKVIDSCRAFEERRVPISLDFKIEDLRDALVESNDTIEKLKAENEHLKKMSSCKFSDDCLRVRQFKAKLEDAKASAYADSVDAGMRERRLKRALWLARAERYKMREFIAREEGNLSNQMSWSRILRERTYDQWVDQLLRIANLANKLHNKCLKEAEEYR